jgi:dienelactone hydrolase
MTPRPPHPGVFELRLRGSRLATAVCCVLGLASGALTWDPARRWLGAARLLTDLGGKNPATADVVTSDLVVDDGTSHFRARLYVPRGGEYRCAVVGHGVQFRGIDEPRLERFASRLAERGIAVLTPAMTDLTDYRITLQGVEVLSAAVKRLSRLCYGDRVGLLGFSFGGGLSLLAARDPSVSRHLAYVASVGGHYDLARVLSFLLTDRVLTPHGVIERKAHEYGLVILLYDHIEAFVPEEDRAVMKAAVKAWLTEDRPRAWALASRRTTEAAEQLFIGLATRHFAPFRERLRAMLSDEEPALRALSPEGKLAQIPVPVYLLHGESDSVIPPEETEWADRELAASPHRTLVTPLIEHVEVNGKPTLADQYALVRFMAALL